jgi:hypothetical protein
MNMPGFMAEASLYKNSARYRNTNYVGRSSNGSAAVIPQTCSASKVIFCNPLINACFGCFAIPYLPGALACFAGCLGGAFAYCWDCIDLIDLPDNGGVGGTPHPCCPPGTRCCGGCTKVPGQGLICEGDCIAPGEECS